MAYLRKPVGKKRRNTQNKQAKFPIAKPLMPSSSVLVVEDSEDKASHKRHLQLMKKESKSFRPNKQITRDVMKRTFTIRRQEIHVVDGATLETLFSTNPTLKYHEEIVCELNNG